MSAVQIRLFGPDGALLPARPNRAGALPGGGRRPQALTTGSTVAYDAADRQGQHMAAWSPYLWSPDGELNLYRDTIVSRVRDLVRNDGWASGAVTRILDNCIGWNFRPISKPDYRALQHQTGLKTFDHAWAKEYGRAVDAHWRAWADDPGRYCDAARNMTFSQMAGVAFRHLIVDGDALALLPYLSNRIGPGRARYGTAVQLIDPDRLSNPQLSFDKQSFRGGVEIDEWGAAVAYWIRRAHQGDWWAAGDSMTWDRIPRESSWGRPAVVHFFEATRAGQHRGGAGVFTPVLQRLKMLIKYDGTELDAAIINAIFAAYVESPFDPSLVKQAMGDDDQREIDEDLGLAPYQAERLEFHKLHGPLLGGARVPVLFPGEKINTVTAARPASNFSAFEGAMLRNVAQGLGLSAQQVSNDWSDVNYSSARAAMLEAWKTLTRRRHEFGVGFASPVRSAWQEECHEIERLPLPKGAPEFFEARGAYGRCRWMGPGRGWIDPVAEKQGAIMGLDGCLSTLEDELADQGLDYEEVLEQRKHELRLLDEMGIPRPEWAGQLIGVDQSQMTADQVAKKPEAV